MFHGTKKMMTSPVRMVHPLIHSLILSLLPLSPLLPPHSPSSSPLPPSLLLFFILIFLHCFLKLSFFLFHVLDLLSFSCSRAHHVRATFSFTFVSSGAVLGLARSDFIQFSAKRMEEETKEKI